MYPAKLKIEIKSSSVCDMLDIKIILKKKKKQKKKIYFAFRHTDNKT
jgi:hypothetical protein